MDTVVILLLAFGLIGAAFWVEGATRERRRKMTPRERAEKDAYLNDDRWLW